MPKTILNATNPSHLNHLKEEYNKRLRFAAISDKELYNQTVSALEDSYEEREFPFHPTHKVVDLMREEWERRNQPNLFSKAFRKL